MSLTLTPAQTPNIRRQPPVTLQASASYTYDVDLVDVTSHLLSDLADNLRPYVDIKQCYDPSYLRYIYTARISLVPLDTRQCILNDRYTYNHQHFTRAEIDAAIQHTYPERFI